MLRRIVELKDIADDVESFIENVDEITRDVESLLENALELIDDVDGGVDERITDWIVEAMDKINDIKREL